MIWIWSIPDNYPNNRIGEYINGSSTDRFLFREGKIIYQEVISPKIVFECAEKHLSDVLPNSGQLIVVSQRVLDILKEVCLQDIQVFNAKVINRGKKIHNYYLINVVNSVQIIDKEASEYKTIKGPMLILLEAVKNLNVGRNVDLKK